MQSICNFAGPRWEARDSSFRRKNLLTSKDYGSATYWQRKNAWTSGRGKGAKAHFTFNVKYLPGQTTTPNGTAKFWIPGGQVDFESTAIEVVVIAGNRVQFWGTGTLNGASVSFRITAVDGQLAGNDGNADAFRIEIWQAGALAFDTQPGAAQDAPVITTIQGGNVQIHQGSR